MGLRHRHRHPLLESANGYSQQFGSQTRRRHMHAGHCFCMFSCTLKHRINYGKGEWGRVSDQGPCRLARPGQQSGLLAAPATDFFRKEGVRTVLVSAREGRKCTRAPLGPGASRNREHTLRLAAIDSKRKRSISAEVLGPPSRWPGQITTHRHARWQVCPGTRPDLDLLLLQLLHAALQIGNARCRAVQVDHHLPISSLL